MSSPIYSYFGHSSVWEIVEDEGFLLAVTMLQVLPLVDATSTDRGYSHAVSDEDDDIPRLFLVGVLLHALRLLNGLLQLPQAHVVPEFRV